MLIICLYNLYNKFGLNILVWDIFPRLFKNTCQILSITVFNMNLKNIWILLDRVLIGINKRSCPLNIHYYHILCVPWRRGCVSRWSAPRRTPGYGSTLGPSNIILNYIRLRFHTAHIYMYIGYGKTLDWAVRKKGSLSLSFLTFVRVSQFNKETLRPTTATQQGFSDSTPKAGSDRFWKSAKSLISSLQLIANSQLSIQKN